MTSPELQERILFGLNELLRETNARLDKPVSRSARFAIDCRKRALEDAITIVRNQQCN